MFQREGRGLYFYSDTKGSGKTMIACAVANEILKTHDISVKFTSVTDYIEHIFKRHAAPAPTFIKPGIQYCAVIKENRLCAVTDILISMIDQKTGIFGCKAAFT